MGMLQNPCFSLASLCWWLGAQVLLNRYCKQTDVAVGSPMCVPLLYSDGLSPSRALSTN